MKKILPLVFLLIACASRETPDKKNFPVLTVSDDEWATYEGRWSTKEGILRIELSLKIGSYGYDSYYKLVESYETKKSAHDTTSYGKYSTQYNGPDNQLAITLHDLNEFSKGPFFRISKLSIGKTSEEMLFVTRGNNELMACNDEYKAFSEDKRHTLHKRSNLFTVEGYVTFENDSAVFFERNTLEHWKLANLGEFTELKKSYRQLAKVKYEGIYVRALAYSIMDEQPKDSINYLVIKRTKNIGSDPELY